MRTSALAGRHAITVMTGRRCIRIAATTGGWIMLKKLAAVAILAGGLCLAACNTVEGLGKDISSVGRATADAAR